MTELPPVIAACDRCHRGYVMFKNPRCRYCVTGTITPIKPVPNNFSLGKRWEPMPAYLIEWIKPLKADLRAMAEEAADKLDTLRVIHPEILATIESALHVAVKRVLEQEPSEAVILKMAECYDSTWGYHKDSEMEKIWAHKSYRAMTAQLLREIE